MARNLIVLGKKIPDTSPQQWQVTDTITLEWGRHCISLGPFPLDPTLDILSTGLGEEAPLHDELAKSFWCWGDKAECLNDETVQDVLRQVVKVIVPLPSPRTETDDQGNAVMVMGGCEIMTMQEAIDQGKEWTALSIPTFAGV